MIKRLMNCAGIVIGVFIVIAYILSWLITCGLVKLITLCFGWTFSWPVATGVWLVICAVRYILSRSSKKK